MIELMGKGGYTRAMKTGRINRGGYWYLRMPEHPSSQKQGYIAEHRFVMEKHIGRLLTRKEVVHHINHDPGDNRIENLELCENAGRHIADHHPEVMEKLRLSSVGREPYNKGRRTYITKICEECGDEYSAWPSQIKNQIWCSRSCASKNIDGRGPNATSFKKGNKPWNDGIGVWLDVECLRCDKPMRIRKCRYEAGRGRYCSRKCLYSRMA